MNLHRSYRLYQMTDDSKNQPFIFRPYDYLIQNGIRINEDRYEAVFESMLTEDLNPIQVRDRILKLQPDILKTRAPGVSDVIVIIENDERTCYFWDTLGLTPVQDFFKSEETAGLSLSTKGYSIEGKGGTWCTVDSKKIDGLTFYLMESEKHGRRASRIILDEGGAIVMDNNENDFDDEAMAAIRKHLHPESILKEFEQQKETIAPAPEPVQGEKKSDTKAPKDPKERVSLRLKLKEKLKIVHERKNR